MFRLMLVTIALISANVFACPELTGEYTCQNSSGGVDDMTFTQRVRGGITYYTLNGQEFPTDGIEYAFETQQIKRGTFAAWCSQRGTVDILNFKHQGQYYNGIHFVGDLSLGTEVTLHNNLLTFKYEGSMRYASGQPAPINQILNCTRK